MGEVKDRGDAPSSLRLADAKVSGSWLYFGCGRSAGHYLFSEGGDTVDWALRKRLDHLDGELAPRPDGRLYVAALHRLESIGFSALSWWDRSVDTRPGSNSIIFAPNLTIPAEDMLVEARRRFPWVFGRLPRDVTISAGDVAR